MKNISSYLLCTFLIINTHAMNGSTEENTNSQLDGLTILSHLSIQSISRSLSLSSNSNNSLDTNNSIVLLNKKRKRTTNESLREEIATLKKITEYQRRDISNLNKENALLHKKIDNIESDTNDKMKCMIEIIKDLVTGITKA